MKNKSVDVVLVGAGTRIEIWSLEKWEAMEQNVDMDEITAAANEHGIFTSLDPHPGHGYPVRRRKGHFGKYILVLGSYRKYMMPSTSIIMTAAMPVFLGSPFN